MSGDDANVVQGQPDSKQAGEAASQSSGSEHGLLAKRVAAAADGHRGQQIWVVADRNAPDARLEVMRQAATKASAGGIVFGPYFTREETLPKDMPLERVVLWFHNRPDPIEIRPDRADALFWSSSAIEKFMLPYYTCMYGAGMAKALEDKFRQQREVTVFCHDPKCDPCIVSPVVNAEQIAYEGAFRPYSP